MDDVAGVERLRDRLGDALAELLPWGARVALLGFPNHPNPGDSAIWLGAVRGLLARGCRVAYACDFHTYDPSALARALGHGPIVLTGGGNLGDLYPEEQGLRERAVRDFPDRTVIQLPQSVHFSDPAAAERARAVFDAHPRFVLTVRDRASARSARALLGLEPTLLPDCAFLLGPLARPVGPTRAVAVVRRRDGEAAAEPTPVAGVDAHDWMEEPPSPFLRAAVRVRHHARDHPARRGLVGRLMSAMYPTLARRRLERALRVLSGGRVVLTDRLHGHVLCLLLGIPHVVVDTAQAKISAFVQTWTAESPLVRTAADFAEGHELAQAWSGCLDGTGDR